MRTGDAHGLKARIYIGESCPVAEHQEICVLAYRDACGRCSHENDSQPTACMFCIRCYAHEPDRYEKTVESDDE